MEPLYNYLREAVEINSDGYYRTVTLVRRENIKCAELTADQFVEMMWEDLENALDEYKNLNHGEAIERHKEYVERRVKEAEAFAAKKWKTDKRRQEYIDRAKFNAENDTWHLREKGIAFDFHPGVDNGIPGVCILSPTNVTEQQLKACFDKVSAAKWWKKGTGWALKYKCAKDSFRNSFRGEVVLLMDESSTAERKQEQKSLDNAIQAWYNGRGTYAGD